MDETSRERALGTKEFITRVIPEIKQLLDSGWVKSMEPVSVVIQGETLRLEFDVVAPAFFPNARRILVEGGIIRMGNIRSVVEEGGGQVLVLGFRRGDLMVTLHLRQTAQRVSTAEMAIADVRADVHKAVDPIAPKEGHVSMEPELPEAVFSEARAMLIDHERNSELPEAVRKFLRKKPALGRQPSFQEAMKSKSTFSRFIGGLDTLEKELDPAMLHEMMIIAAEEETSEWIQLWLRQFKTRSWSHAMSSHEVFALMMENSTFISYINKLEYRPLVRELLIAATRASRLNAQWFLNYGETTIEDVTDERDDYRLREALGSEDFEKVMAAARQYFPN